LTNLKYKTNKRLSLLASWLKHIIVPGANGATAYEIISTFIKSIKDIRLSERAAAISYNFLLAIPPSLIFLFSLATFLPPETVHDVVLNSIKSLSPNPKLFAALETIITDFMNNKKRELLSFGFLFTVIVSSNGVMGILRSFDRDSPAQIKRTGIARRWKALWITLGLMLLLLISITVIIIQTSIIDKFIVEHIGNTVLIKILSGCTLFLVLYFAICILYKYGPSLNQKFPFFSTGALLASLLFVLISIGFFFIANNFINYNKVYGSIGTLLMLMIWMFITGLVILIGYEINLTILLFSGKKSKVAAGANDGAAKP
jgi:membrane protein